MKSIPCLIGLVAASVLAGCASRTTSESAAAAAEQIVEPTHNGKSLSVLLDELEHVGFARRADPEVPQVRAIRAIGTNAIPWLLREFQPDSFGSLSEGHRRDTRLARGSLGFWALGELGAPAIPELLTLLEKYPGYVPGALAGIGQPAVPALHQCLANMKMYTTSGGTYAVIPGNTISAIYNAASFGPFARRDILVFTPVIEAWAEQSTNRQARMYAAYFLDRIEELD